MWRSVREVGVAVEAAYGFGTLAATLAISWRFGVAWGVAVVLAGLLLISVRVGLAQQRQLNAASTEERAAVLTVGTFIEQGNDLMQHCSSQGDDSDIAATEQRALSWNEAVTLWLRHHRPHLVGRYESGAGHVLYSGDGPRVQTNKVRNYLQVRVKNLIDIQPML